MAAVIFSKASGLNDSIYGKSQEPILAIIEEQVEAFQSQSCIKDVFVTEKTKNFAERFSTETALGNFSPVGEAGPYPENGWQEGYSTTLEPDTWKNSFEITMEMVEDAKHGKIKQRAGAFTLSYNRTREMFAAAILMGGASSSIDFGAAGKTRKFSTLAADGQPYFNTQHPSITGGYAEQGNLYASAFSYDALCYAQARMQNYRDDDGNLLGINPDTIMIPNLAMLKKAVFNAIGAEGLPDTANNSLNFQYGLWNVIINPYLNVYLGSTGAPWFLLDSSFNQAYYGAVWLDRVGLTIRSELAANDNNVWKGRARYTAGFNNWRAMCMSYDGASSDKLES